METLIITSDDVAKVLSKIGVNVFMDQVIEKLEFAFRNFDASQTEVRQRDGFTFKGLNPGILEWMPVTESDYATVKMVGYNPGNPLLHKIPTIISTISLFEVKTGHLIALADGNFLTAVRTGAASAIASKVLASENSTVIGLIGCGCQAVTQLHALSRVYEISQVYIYDKDMLTALTFLDHIRFLKLNVDVKIVSQQIIEEKSDIICTATSVEIGQGPVLDGLYLQKHIHINSIGADLPGKTEIPLNFLKRSLVCPDFLPQALVEGECQQLASSDIGPDIIELVKHPEKYKKYKNLATVFDSTGFALEDQVAMNTLLDYVSEYKLGTKTEIEHIPRAPKNPYDFAINNFELPLRNKTNAL